MRREKYSEQTLTEKILKIVLFRDREDISESLTELRPLRVYACPAISIQRGSDFSSKQTFDFVLVTSKNALRFSRRSPRGKHWIVIGKKTWLSLPLEWRKSISKKTILNESNSKGVLKFFDSRKKAFKNASVFYPCSSLSGTEIPKALQKYGYRLKVLRTYRTQILSVRKPLQSILKRHQIDAFFMTSPSTVTALQKSFSKTEVKRWPVKWVAIGPTTAAAARKWGLKPLLMAPKPSLRAMKLSLQRIKNY